MVACWHCSRGLGQGLVYGAPFLSLSMHLFFVSVLDSLSRSRALPIRCVTVFAFALALCVCVCARARMHACECMSGRASLVTGRAVQVVFHDNDVHKFDLRELTACKDNVRRPLSFSPWPVFPCSFALTSFPCTHTHPLIHTHSLSLSLSLPRVHPALDSGAYGPDSTGHCLVDAVSCLVVCDRSSPNSSLPKT